MKKNDTISLVVYALMLAIALVVGIVMIRPLTESIDTDALGGISFPVVIVLAIVVGILLSAGLIEVGHLIGAKIGHYEILSFVILGLGAKKGKDGKFHFYAGGFDGLTGEVAVSPKDREKSSLRAYIYLPLLFLVLLIIAMAVCMVFSGPQEAPTTPWLYAASLLVLTVAGIILLYDIFPAELDSTNDGYRLVLISNPKNKMAYNDTLLARKCERMGEAIPALEPYRDLTDFTASINNILMYQALREKKVQKALEITDIAIESKKSVSREVYGDAISMKLSLDLLYGDKEAAKQWFIDLKTDDKKYIAQMPTMPSLRAYLLASALIEESESETEVAIARHVSLVKKVAKNVKDVEDALYKEGLEKAKAAHPDWAIFNEEQAVEEEAPKEEPKAEETPKDEGK